MRNLGMRIVAAAVALLGLVAGAYAQQKPASDIKDEVEQSQKAQAFREIMSAPDKAIPQAVLDGAQCVAVFPSVIKAAFGVGGGGGRGVASCRTAAGWSAPAYFNLGGGSFGFQIGVEATDLVLLFMTAEGINSLLATKFTVGGEASVAAGPVGRQAGGGTDLKLNAQILSYSRSKGLFAGVALQGAVIERADGDMRDVYGPSVTAKEVLKDSKVTAPSGIQAFPNALMSYSARKATR